MAHRNPIPAGTEWIDGPRCTLEVDIRAETACRVLHRQDAPHSVPATRSIGGTIRARARLLQEHCNEVESLVRTSSLYSGFDLKWLECNDAYLRRCHVEIHGTLTASFGVRRRCAYFYFR